MHWAAVILMGGEGRRMGSSIPKQFHLLDSLKVYERTLQTFRQSALFQEIILVCHPAWTSQVKEETAPFPEVSVVTSGPTRQASSRQGLLACRPGCDYVMIHDAVRPFVSLQILKNNYEAALKYGAVDTCIASADTLLITHNGTRIASIPSRDQFRRGQTPQTFAYPLIDEAHQKTTRTNASDDCQLVLDLGLPVVIVEGSEDNLKITTDRDLEVAKLILSREVP